MGDEIVRSKTQVNLYAWNYSKNNTGDKIIGRSPLPVHLSFSGFAKIANAIRKHRALNLVFLRAAPGRLGKSVRNTPLGVGLLRTRSLSYVRPVPGPESLNMTSRLRAPAGRNVRPLGA